jgi:hypothetical protein
MAARPFGPAERQSETAPKAERKHHTHRQHHYQPDQPTRRSLGAMKGNIYAALDQTKKSRSKTSAAEKEQKQKQVSEKKASAVSTAELEKAIFSAPNFSTSNWADDDDDDEHEHGAHDPADDGWSRVPVSASARRAEFAMAFQAGLERSAVCNHAGDRCSSRPDRDGRARGGGRGGGRRRGAPGEVVTVRSLALLRGPGASLGRCMRHAAAARAAAR